MKVTSCLQSRFLAAAITTVVAELAFAQAAPAPAAPDYTLTRNFGIYSQYDDTFGMPDNAWYLDLSANYPLNDNRTINAHCRPSGV